MIEKSGHKIVYDALSEPTLALLRNGGHVDVDVFQNGNPHYGYNALTEKYEDLFEAGVIDPVKVTRTALQNAASAAGTLITTSHAIIEI